MENSLALQYIDLIFVFYLHWKTNIVNHKQRNLSIFFIIVVAFLTTNKPEIYKNVVDISNILFYGLLRSSESVSSSHGKAQMFQSWKKNQNLLHLSIPWKNIKAGKFKYWIIYTIKLEHRTWLKHPIFTENTALSEQNICLFSCMNNIQ